MLHTLTWIHAYTPTTHTCTANIYYACNGKQLHMLCGLTLALCLLKCTHTHTQPLTHIHSCLFANLCAYTLTYLFTYLLSQKRICLALTLNLSLMWLFCVILTEISAVTLSLHLFWLYMYIFHYSLPFLPLWCCISSCNLYENY